MKHARASPFVYLHQRTPRITHRQPPIPPALYPARRIGVIHSYCSASGKGIMEWDGRTFAADQSRGADMLPADTYHHQDDDGSSQDETPQYFPLMMPEALMGSRCVAANNTLDGGGATSGLLCFDNNEAQYLLNGIKSELAECLRLLDATAPQADPCHLPDAIDVVDRLGNGKLTARFVQSQLISKASVNDLLIRVTASQSQLCCTVLPWYLTRPFSFDPCDVYEFSLGLSASGKVACVANGSVCNVDGSPVSLRVDSTIPMEDIETHMLESLRARLLWASAIAKVKSTKLRAPGAVAAKAVAIHSLEM